MTRIKDTGKKQPKIKNTGKMESLLDPIKIAKGVGASRVITDEKQTEGGKNYIELISVTKTGRKNKKRIWELNENNAKKLALIGTAGGESLFHCLYLAANHTKNFWDRVCGYRFGVGTPFPYSISFYKKR